MTREIAIGIIKELRSKPLENRELTALVLAISALENVGHLKDRPCSVCEFHKENGCCKWTCVFTDRLFGGMND